MRMRGADKAPEQVAAEVDAVTAGRRAPRAVALQAFGMLHFDEGGGRRCMIPLCRRCAEPRRLKARCWKTA